MDLSLILKEVNFVERYKVICKNHNDFENSMSGAKNTLYNEVLNRLGYDYKYYSNGSFYQIISKINDIKLQLHLVLKNGIIEPLLYVKVGGETINPKGRLDFIPQKMGIEFNRALYNIPKYTSEAELEEILKELFSIYEDIKKEMIKEFRKNEDS